MMNRKFPQKGEKGFTLIEIIIAMGVLTIGVLGMTSMFETSIRGNNNGKNLTAANRLVAKHMEEIRAVAFNTVAGNVMASADYTNQAQATSTTNPLNPDDTLTITANYKESAGGINSADYQLTLIRILNEPMIDATLDKVIVRVSWTDRFGTHSSAAATYVTTF